MEKTISELWGQLPPHRKYYVVSPHQGTVVKLSSDDWRVFDGGVWREMTVEEQIEESK